MAAELVHYNVSNAIAEITLDRAPVNALSAIAAATPAVTLRRRCFRLTVMVTTRFL